MSRFIVTTWHGEGRSLHYLVDTGQPEEEQPAVMDTFDRRSDAEHWASMFNRFNKEPHADA